MVYMRKSKSITKIVVIIFIIIVAAVSAYIAYMSFRQVTPEKAERASQDFATEVKDYIDDVPGFAITKDGKPGLKSVEDEVGSTDYTLSVQYLVQKSEVGSEDNFKGAVTELAQQLPKNNYGIHVENTSKANVLCVYASRYLNNNGNYIPQGSTENTAKFILDEDFSNGSHISPCADLLAS